MPGIFGVVASSVRRTKFSELLRQAHDVPGLRFIETAYDSDQCTMISLERRVSPAPQSHFARDTQSNAVLVLEGEIYDCKQICEEYSVAGSDVSAALLRAYLAAGDRFIDRIDGEFNIVIYEPVGSRLSVFTDHVGSYPFYYWQSGREIHFGSEKKCLLAASDFSRRIDPIGLLQPFAHQHNLGDRTFIDGLRRMPASTRLTYVDGQLELTEHGNYFRRQSLNVGARDLLESWEHALKVATAKRVRNKPRLLISLSSGLDSRAIACALDRARRPISARTMGHPESFEVRYAARIAAALKFDHDIENSLEYRYSDVVRRIVWRTDGETDFRNGLSMFTHGRTRLVADDVMGGWLGDVTSGAHLRPFMLRPMPREEFIAKTFRWYVQHNIDDLRNVFSGVFLKRHWPSVRRAFEHSYAPYGDLPNTNAHEMWDIRNRQTRMTISSMPVDSHLFGKVRPFFDRDYLEFVLSIPLRWRIGQNLYKSLISRIGPEIRGIPNGNTNVRIHSSPSANLFGYGLSLGGRVAERVKKRLSARMAIRGKSKVSEDIALHFRRDEGLRRIIEKFVHSECMDDEIFDRERILQMLARHYGGSADYSDLISILATYVVALEYFVYDRKVTCPHDALPVL